MSLPTGFGFLWSGAMPEMPRTEDVLVQSQLMRIMAFLNISIHQICNDPIARDKVACYYRLQKNIDRQMELTELCPFGRAEKSTHPGGGAMAASWR